MSPHSKHINPESFPYLLDEIFAGLDDTFPPEITISLAPDRSPKVDTVCGKNDIIQYLNLLKYLKAESLAKMTQAISQLSPMDFDSFMIMAKRRVRRLLCSFTDIAHEGEKVETSSSVSWRTNKVRCICNDMPDNNPRINCEVIRQTKRHARLAYLVFKQMEERMNYFSCTTECPTTLLENLPGNVPKTKFRLACSVQYLGAFLGTLIDRQLLENPNISELCRRVAATFITIRTESISPLSLRNAIHTPDPQALEQLLMDFEVIIKDIKRHLRRNSS